MSRINTLFRRPVWLALLAVPALLTLGAAFETPRSITFSDVLVKTGIRVRYAASGDSLGEPLIFLHGMTDSWFSFSEILPKLPPRYRAFALDQRGHGGSERPDSGYAMRDFAKDVVAFMDAMRLPRATVVGHSMGTLVAREVAALAPERVAGLVLLGAPLSGDNSVMRELDTAVSALGDSIPRAFAYEFQASTVSTPVAPAFIQRATDESMRVPPRIWRDALAGILAPRDLAALKRARFQTLIVHGSEDNFFPRSEQEQLLKVIPNAKLVVYEGAGHAPHWDNPAQFARDLELFLKR